MITQEMVSEALDNARDNDYDYSQMKSDDALLQVATDMIDFNADFEECSPAELLPFIREWQAGQ